MLSDREFELLEHFETPSVIEENDLAEVDRLVRLHMLKKAFLEDDEGRISGTARLTKVGNQVLILEREARGLSPHRWFARLKAKFAA